MKNILAASVLILGGCSAATATDSTDNPTDNLTDNSTDISTGISSGDTAADSAANILAPVQETISMFRTLTDTVSVAPQISLDDVAAAKAEGITLIVNNRPDGEDPGAPQSADIEAAAKAAGIKYIAIPITHSGFSGPQVDAMIAALAGGDKTLAYCRSGTRSTLLWSLAQAKQGMAADEIARLAGNAGYDITPVRAMVDGLASAGAAGAGP